VLAYTVNFLGAFLGIWLVLFPLLIYPPGLDRKTGLPLLLSTLLAAVLLTVFTQG